MASKHIPAPSPFFSLEQSSPIHKGHLSVPISPLLAQTDASTQHTEGYDGQGRELVPSIVSCRKLPLLLDFQDFVSEIQGFTGSI